MADWLIDDWPIIDLLISQVLQGSFHDIEWFIKWLNLLVT